MAFRGRLQELVNERAKERSDAVEHLGAMVEATVISALGKFFGGR